MTILDECRKRGLKFAIRAQLCASLKKHIQDQSEDQWQPLVDANGQSMEDESTLRITHCMEKSEQAFTLVVQRRKIEGQQELELNLDDNQECIRSGAYLYRAIAVGGAEDMSDSDWVHWYNQRGEHSENRIKELKNDFAADRMPCRDFNANALFFSLCMLAFNLFALLRIYLPACFESSRAKTIRWRIYALAGKVVRHGRKIYLKLKEQHRLLLESILSPLRQLARAP